jgi:tripartite-type tricarboxylate transporter receptor subunit TctC
LVVPFAPGGGVDNVARALAAQMAEGMQHAVVVENRVGAGGIVGAKYVANSAPDGHTLLMGTQTTLAVVPLLIDILPRLKAGDSYGATHELPHA